MRTLRRVSVFHQTYLGLSESLCQRVTSSWRRGVGTVTSDRMSVEKKWSSSKSFLQIFLWTLFGFSLFVSFVEWMWRQFTDLSMDGRNSTLPTGYLRVSPGSLGVSVSVATLLRQPDRCIKCESTKLRNPTRRLEGSFSILRHSRVLPRTRWETESPETSERKLSSSFERKTYE